ncbi:hypothetical protein L1987_39962 [Smallanthus sonchifolius]|uniref:Uncharacterized protein n=1 Tax=Smallanthus sonchifolius TaxID=185202 RepID=A0ACB9GTQ2_9ASTR|nr:hypothetical protein L1987_39962 [Smallanthus sonchifolius]
MSDNVVEGSCKNNHGFRNSHGETCYEGQENQDRVKKGKSRKFEIKGKEKGNVQGRKAQEHVMLSFLTWSHCNLLSKNKSEMDLENEYLKGCYDNLDKTCQEGSGDMDESNNHKSTLIPEMRTESNKSIATSVLVKEENHGREQYQQRSKKVQGMQASLEELVADIQTSITKLEKQFKDSI